MATEAEGFFVSIIGLIGFAAVFLLVMVLYMCESRIRECEKELQNGQECKLIAVAKEEPK